MDEDFVKALATQAQEVLIYQYVPSFAIVGTISGK
jgi:hypothetical protein